jgi:hypothetical protein
MKPTTKSAIASAALGLAFSTAALADPPVWDQKQVTALATQLVQVVDAALAASKEAPGQATALQQRRRDAAVSGYRRVREAAADYRAKLEAGRDRDLTEAHFRNLRNLVKSTRASAGDAEPTPKAQEQLDKVDSLLGELGRYYPDA